MLTNKYRIVYGENERHQAELRRLDYVSVLAGERFWTWLNAGEVRTQDWVLEGIGSGADQFLHNNPEVMSAVDGGAATLLRELRVKYRLPVDGSINWTALLHAVNNDRGETLGAEAED